MAEKKRVKMVKIECEWDLGLSTLSRLSLKETKEAWKEEFYQWAADDTGYTYEEAIAANLLTFIEL